MDHSAERGASRQVGGTERQAGGGRLTAYLALLKPRVMSLVVFTALVGLMLAPGSLHPMVAIAALICIAVGAGASGAINMWYDADIDGQMLRTCDRPIPRGHVKPRAALIFGTVLSFASVLAMGALVNLLSAALLALTIAFYVFVYTMWLKRRTPQNIVIGGAAGAFPPMIGWAAASGDVSLASIALFAIIFFWTPPHFWALALYRADDYRNVGVPMLPVVAGKAATRRQILIYSLILIPVTLSPVALGICGVAYGLGAGLLGLIFLAFAVQVWRTGDDNDRPARRLFAYSIFYLFALFALMLGERLMAGWA
ncbi:MAG: protoheme IX farnesyltransferase [Rhodospirillaceae bacterium]|nr:protoheme IX farnesyltransferase [Rhodospirillaceae bacterium]MBT4490612.1 protoheme IX farnesyltransferase [Rhodospirillaceae bacterium]MBT5193802.1 protoheme IX farnesyltransferase [Rhodospirillaceae bacterium]MBT5894317.1 protoheme IX farnesyltransferase [Rhodospirillaceae bacterium]MBT6429783.1 protoheme IX farnesyltransferase [Rhodospirillaceae bacterium]